MGRVGSTAEQRDCSDQLWKSGLSHLAQGLSGRSIDENAVWYRRERSIARGCVEARGPSAVFAAQMGIKTDPLFREMPQR
jgi:hypothetical protein